MKRFLTTILLVGSASLVAQTPEQFEVVKGPPSESLPAAPLVFIAYSFVWVVVCLYIAALWKRLGRVERELHEIVSRPHASAPPASRL